MKNTLKRFQFILVLLALCAAPCFVGCSDDDDDAPAEITIPEKILAEGMTFGKSGGTNILSIKSNVALVVTSSAPDWCQVIAETSTSSNILKYSIKATANTDTNIRQATITIKSGVREVGSFIVTQTAADGLVITPTSFNDVAGEGAQIEVKLTTNGDVKITCNDKWITEVTNRSAMIERTVTFNVAANYGEARTGSITFTLGDLTETVTVNQLAASIASVGMESDALVLAAKIYAGWNIGNTLEATGGETSWNNPMVTEDYVKKIKDLGFNAIRIPCAWSQYIEDEATFKIKDSWLNRVNEVVGYCVANDMYAIVNIHWDGGWLEENCIPAKQEENNIKQHALWTQIANKLNHYDEHLIFAGANEPNVDNAQKMTVLKSYLQTFVNAVRATGGNNAVRNLIVQGPNTDISTTDQLFGTMPTDVVDNRMMVEVHYYNPWTFCGMEKDESWGKMAYFWGDFKVAGSDRNATSGDAAEMKTLFGKMKSRFVDNGIPVILGEYGAITMHKGLGDLQEAHDKSRSLFDETVTREAKNHGMVPFYWETGGVVDRYTGAIKDNYAIDGIKKGAAAGNYPY